jgi:S1-C subfamily serine protease
MTRQPENSGGALVEGHGNVVGNPSEATALLAVVIGRNTW